MNFMLGLPVLKGYDSIMAVVDKFSKRTRCIPAHTRADAAEGAQIFFDGVIRHHELPQIIISDESPIFTSIFWRSRMQLLGVKLSMKTAHRAQSDGQRASELGA